MRDRDEFNKYIEEIEGYSDFISIGNNLVPTKLISDGKPWRWSREIYYREFRGVPSGLPGITIASFKAGTYRAPQIITKWGLWLGTSFVFSQALSLSEIADMKFSPCGGTTLCLKSQVSPSISIYPLDECKQAGIEYIELNKYPFGEEGWFRLNRLADEFVGATTVSRFYIASPCTGKLKIEKGKCKCSVHKKPYIDFETTNNFIFKCTVLDNSGSTNCTLEKFLSYSKEKKRENVGFSLILNSMSDLGTLIKYNLTFNVTNTIKDDEAYNLFRTCCPTDHHDFFNEMDLSCLRYISPDLPDNFTCEFALPSVPFYTVNCSGSDIWLTCVNWTSEGTEIKELPTIDGAVETNITKWCCMQWNITKFGVRSEKIINVSGCDDYASRRVKSIIENSLQDKLSSWFSDINFANEIKGNAKKAIIDNSRIELITGRDPNYRDIGRIYDINLPDNSEVDCLIVTFYDKSNGTRGFCYTSPPGGELLKDIGWTALSIVADIGVQGLLSITGVGASAAGVIGCEVGNAIMWFGQNQISEEKEKRLWPKNLFFGNYFGD